MRSPCSAWLHLCKAEPESSRVWGAGWVNMCLWRGLWALVSPRMLDGMVRGGWGESCGRDTGILGCTGQGWGRHCSHRSSGLFERRQRTVVCRAGTHPQVTLGCGSLLQNGGLSHDSAAIFIMNQLFRSIFYWEGCWGNSHFKHLPSMWVKPRLLGIMNFLLVTFSELINL